MLDRWK